MQPLLYGFSSSRIITCEHNYIDPHFSEKIDCLGTCRFFNVGDSNNTLDSIFCSEEERCFAVIGKAIQFFFYSCNGNVVFRHQTGVAGIPGFTVNVSANAFAENGGKVTYLHGRYAFVFGIIHNGRSQGMFAFTFKSRRDR